MRNSFLNGSAFPADVDVNETQIKTKSINGTPSSILLTADNVSQSTNRTARARSHSTLSMGDTNSMLSSTLRRTSHHKRVNGSGTTVDSSQSSLRGQNLIQSVKKSLAKTKRQWDRTGFIHVIYVFVLLAYSFVGGVVFMTLDGPHADRLLNAHRNRCIHLRESMWNRLLDDCTNGSFIDCVNRTRSYVDLLDHCLRTAPPVPFNHSTSDYWNSLIYAITVFTTIGYGNIVVLSTEGRVAMILYAMIGIPLFFAFLNDMGQWFHFKFLKLYDWFRRKWLNSRLYKTLLDMKRRRSLKPPSKIASGTVETRKLKVVKSKDDVGDKDGNNSLIFAFAVAVLVFYLVVVCGLFMIMVRGQWGFLQAFYFLFQSISLIGFGDEFPDDPNVVLINIIFIIIGIILLSMCFFILQEWIRGKTYRLSTQVRRSVRRWRHHRPTANGLLDRRGMKNTRFSTPLLHLGGNGGSERRMRRRANHTDESVAGQRLAVVHDCSPVPGRRTVVTVLAYDDADQTAADDSPIMRRQRVGSLTRRAGVHSVDETLIGGKSNDSKLLLSPFGDGPLEAEDIFMLRSSGSRRVGSCLRNDKRRHTVMCLGESIFLDRERTPSWLKPKEDRNSTKRRLKMKQSEQKSYSILDRPQFGKFQWIADEDEEYEEDDIEEKEEIIEEDTVASDSENAAADSEDSRKTEVLFSYEKEEFL